MYQSTQYKQRRFGFKGAAALFSAFLIVLSVSACGDSNSGGKPGDKGTGKGELAPVSEGQALPEGHPTMNDEKSFAQMPEQDHSKIKSTKPVRVSDAIKAKYKTITIEVSDNSKGTKDQLKMDVGSTKELADGFSIKADIFLPDYTILKDYIASNTEELNNPAVMVELYKDGKVVASGWVFEGLVKYNSYKHLRYGVVLKPTK